MTNCTDVVASICDETAAPKLLTSSEIKPIVICVGDRTAVDSVRKKQVCVDTLLSIDCIKKKEKPRMGGAGGRYVVAK